MNVVPERGFPTIIIGFLMGYLNARGKNKRSKTLHDATTKRKINISIAVKIGETQAPNVVPKILYVINTRLTIDTFIMNYKTP